MSEIEVKAPECKECRDRHAELMALLHKATKQEKVIKALSGELWSTMRDLIEDERVCNLRRAEMLDAWIESIIKRAST